MNHGALPLFPRTLLLTWWSPDTRYKVIQKIADRIPHDSLLWASLWHCPADGGFPYTFKAFVPRQLHWRLRRSALNYLATNEWQSRKTARRIAAWARPYAPDVLWVLAELGTASVGFHLRRELGIPVHTTIHDANETARPNVPWLYYPFLMRSLDRLFRSASGADAISAELRAYLTGRYANITDQNSVVFHPSVQSTVIADAGRPPCENDVRRIGFCGSMRTGVQQWQAFLALLAQLPFQFEIVAFVDRDALKHVATSPNVRILPQAFAPTEAAVIETFQRMSVAACYLGLYRDRGRLLFSRTSLSAKLTTYAASAIPVIVDGPADSAAWRLVKEYGAGVLLDGDPIAGVRDLNRLFDDATAWRRMAEGARELACREFDIERNMVSFQALLARTAGRS